MPGEPPDAHRKPRFGKAPWKIRSDKPQHIGNWSKLTANSEERTKIAKRKPEKLGAEIHT